MKNLLFLVHRIPYPPNKGDKIRSYHFLKGLAKHYNIYLASFIDDPEDWQYVDKVKELTVESVFEGINPLFAKIKSVIGLLTGLPLTVPYYKNNKIQQWVDNTVKEQQIDKIFVFSSAMAQFIQNHQNADVLIDFVDVDSDKWQQYSKKASWPMSWIYKREAKELLCFDKQVATLAKMNIFVSKDESKLFQSLVDIEPRKIGFVNNGVDVDYFTVNGEYDNPYASPENTIVFTGAMDYWANVDAVVWFVQEVFPIVKQHCPDAVFYIVGSKPSKEVLQLANITDVVVTGRVEDIRPYIHYSSVVVAPLLIARGIQNKVLEAMAMGKQIVATSQAIEGINITDQNVVIADDAESYAQYVQVMMKQNQYAEENRLFVEKEFSWGASLQRLTQIID